MDKNFNRNQSFNSKEIYREWSEYETNKIQNCFWLDKGNRTGRLSAH